MKKLILKSYQIKVKIFLDDLILRHFVTDIENIIYEDEEGAIFISADKKGIYKIEFTGFR